MDSAQFKVMLDFDTALRIGSIGEARFTNCGDSYRFKAKVIKLNENTLRVISMEDNKPYMQDDKNRVFSITRFCNFKNFTANNGFYPIKEVV